MADIKTVTLPDNSTYNLRDSNCVKATSSSLGLVKPDNSTITISADGTISSSGGGSVEALTAAEILAAVTAGWGSTVIGNADTTGY